MDTGKIGLVHDYGAVGDDKGGLGLSMSRWIGGRDAPGEWRGTFDNGVAYNGGSVTVSADGVYHDFYWNVATDQFTSNTGSINTLQLVDNGSQDRKMIFVAEDGSVYAFETVWTAYDLDNLHPDQGGFHLGRLIELVRPDGEVITYQYINSARPSIISTNLGYMQRAVDEWTPINLGAIYCPYSLAACGEFSASQWPGHSNPRPNFQVTGETRQAIYRHGSDPDIVEDVYRNIYSTITYPNGDQIVGRYDPAAVYTTSNGSVAVPVEDGIKSVIRFGSTWHYSGFDNNAFNFVKTVTAPSGAMQRYEFDQTGSGLLQKTETVPAGGGTPLTTLFEYDPSSLLVSRVTYPEGNKTEYTYSSGRVAEIRTLAKPGWNEPMMVVSHTYEACSGANRKYCGKPSTSTDERGQVTKYKYASTHGGVTEVQSPYQAGVGYTKTHVEYGQFYAWYRTSGSATQVMDSRPVWRITKTISCAVSTEAASCVDGGANVRVTEYSYQQGSASTPSNIQLVEVLERSGDSSVSSSVKHTYDARGRKVAEDGPLPSAADTVWFEYDAKDNITRMTWSDPDGAGPQRFKFTKREFNAANQVEIEARGWSTSHLSSSGADTIINSVDFRYDTYGREKERVTLASNGSAISLVQTTYDSSSRVECVALRMNPATYSALPGSACTQTILGEDRISRTVYDAYGRPYKTIQGVGTPVETNAQEKTFTPNGMVKTIKDGKGNLTTYTYDGLDRLTKTEFPNKAGPGSSASDYEEATFKVESSRSTTLVATKRLRDGQTFSYAYDALSRTTSVDAPGTAADVAMTYDGLGNVLTLSKPGHTISRSWDALGRMKSEQGPLGTVQYGYNAGGQLERITHPDGFYVTYQYDAFGAPLTVKENGSTTLATYTYDPIARIVYLMHGNNVYSYLGYDGSGAVKDFDFFLPSDASYNQEVDFARNAAGQLVGKAQTNPGYLPGSSAVSTTYSINGLNQVTGIGSTPVSHDDRGNLTNDDLKSYSYDAFNRLVGISGGVTLDYDPAGRLYHLAGSSNTRFLYAGESLIAEYDQSGQVLRRYVHGTSADTPLVWYEGAAVSNSARRHLTVDERGSVVLITANTGSVVGRNKYDEYGVPDPGNIGRFQFTGQTWLVEAALYFYKTRMYHPALGRFVQSDSIGYRDGLNLYAYVGNDPIGKVDPNGAKMVCAGREDHDQGKCIYIDFNGDGNGKDDDISDRTAGGWGEVLKDYINKYGSAQGVDVSGDGLKVENMGASGAEEYFFRAMSQLVGHAEGGWAPVKALVIGPASKLPGAIRNAKGAAFYSRYDQKVYAKTDAKEFYRDFKIGEFSGANTARILIHERNHPRDWFEWLNADDQGAALGRRTYSFFALHHLLDQQARSRTVEHGFGQCQEIPGSTFGKC